jgi:hypothetical protein
MRRRAPTTCCHQQADGAVGDQVIISGVVVLNRDFGMGYSYPLLIEDATITPKK